MPMIYRVPRKMRMPVQGAVMNFVKNLEERNVCSLPTALQKL